MLKKEKTSRKAKRKELENQHLKVSLLPEFGGKICSLIHKRSGTELLKQPLVPVEQIDPPFYGEDFSSSHAFGFDECFPNIAPGRYETDEKFIQLPDHGEVWCGEASVIQKNGELILSHSGRSIHYMFVKKVKLKGNRLIINYSIENLEQAAFSYIWSAHPLLEVSQGDELLVPPSMEEVTVNWTSDENLWNLGDRLSWPEIDTGNPRKDFRIVQPKSDRFAAKLFGKMDTADRVGIYRKEADLSLLFHYNPETVPYLGLWLCYGGWPKNNSTGDYTVALEPSRGGADDLAYAIKQGLSFHIEPSEIQNWQLEVSIKPGKYSMKRMESNHDQ